MPVYEYFCEACQKQFESVLTMHQHDEDKVICPQCGSNKVKQLAATFTAVTSKKS
jgi:putative FmdB family regulatory protein